nr:WAT1-related protein At5g07050-like [Ipomoea batatas]
MTFSIFMQIFVLGLLGPVVDQNLYYAGLKFTSPTFSCAMSNILPAMAFVMGVVCKMEKVNIKKVRCQAKVIGTLVTLGGAMVMTLYKGHLVNLFWSNHIYTPNQTSSFDKDWVKGSILLILATIAWASDITLRKYTAQLSLTAMVCFIGTLQSIAVTFVMEHRSSVWSIGWDINLFAAAYAGIVSSGIAYYVQGIVMQKRGPVFVTAFSPLMMIIVAIMGSFILAENIFVGSVAGAVLIVMGLYAVLWGKYREYKEKEADEIQEAVKGISGNKNERMMKAPPVAIIAISPNISQPPMLAMEAPKH